MLALSNFLVFLIKEKKTLKLKTKIKTYNTMVMPCIAYRAETWNCSWKQILSLNGIQYRQLRSISGKTWRDKISHVDILQSVKFGTNQKFEWALSDNKTKIHDLKSVETIIRLCRLRYAGYVLRMDNTGLPKFCSMEK